MVAELSNHNRDHVAHKPKIFTARKKRLTLENTGNVSTPVSLILFNVRSSQLLV